MLELYWTLFVVGIVLAVIAVVLGEVLEGILGGLGELLSLGGGGVFHPITLIAAMTAWGGSGIMLTRYTNLPVAGGAIVAAIITLVLVLLLYFLYVKPMRNAEQSLAYSRQEWVGKLGEVNLTIPATGFGEVVFTTAYGRAMETASSYDGEEIPTGAKVVVVEVVEGVVRVTPLLDI